MTVGIPKALLYFKYHAFVRAFFEALGARVIVSPDTNREILDTGALTCADEACLPVKVFHGHAAWLKDRCDCVLVPRFVRMEKGLTLCPMLCGLPDMVRGALPGLPLLDAPVNSLCAPEGWARAAAKEMGCRRGVDEAISRALCAQRAWAVSQPAMRGERRIALIGHAYNLYDSFVSMDLLRKLGRFGIGAYTEEDVAEADISRAAAGLYKAPFWYFARRYYGAAAYLCASRQVEGVLYVSAFSCGVDAVVAELVAHAAGDLPMMVVKLDEHTGEAGLDTRLEAFADMLERRSGGHHIPADGQHYACSESVL